MAHLVSTLAFQGKTPWHGLGIPANDDWTFEQWRANAGLNFTVLSEPVRWNNNLFPNRHILYRSDNQFPLSIVSKDYHIVQPEEIWNFFTDLINLNDYQFEVAGALLGGKRIWVLARINDGAEVRKNDKILPYLLLATSYDASMATIAKFTTIRVVCNNTLTMAASMEGLNEVRLYHNVRFDPDKVKQTLGLRNSTWNTFMNSLRALDSVGMNDKLAKEFMVEVVEPDSRAFKAIMANFSQIPSATAWDLLNSVTNYVDFYKGRNDNSRLNSAWFGEGEKLKQKAYQLLTEM